MRGPGVRPRKRRDCSLSQSCKSRLPPHRGWAGQDSTLLVLHLKWGKLERHRISLTCRALTGAVTLPVSQELQASSLERMKLKYPDIREIPSEKEFCASQGPQSQETEASSSTSHWQFPVLVWVATAPALCCSPSRTCPLPSPLFLRIWEVPPQPAALQWLGSAVWGLGDPAHSREGLCRA